MGLMLIEAEEEEEEEEEGEETHSRARLEGEEEKGKTFFLDRQRGNYALTPWGREGEGV